MSSEWIKHDGKDMPVPGDTMVFVRLRGGFEDHGAVKASYWHHDEPAASNWCHVDSERDYDIVAYRVAP